MEVGIKIELRNRKNNRVYIKGVYSGETGESGTVNI